MRTKKVKIGNRWIGKGEPCFIIAEAGSNHDRNLDQAKALIDAAVDAKADAVKFQSFTAEKIAAKTKNKIATINYPGAKTLYDLYKKAELPPEWQSILADYCKKKKIIFLSSPFDEEAADELDELGVPAFKIASFEMVHIPLLQHIAKKGKPIILSTGMATLGEISDSVKAILGVRNVPIVLLHCTSSYPAAYKDAHLAAMETMRDVFHFPIGYSDHTLGITVPITAAARGANMIEKHFTIDKSLPGPDHAFSLAPQELRDMVEGIRNAEASIGSPQKKTGQSEKVNRERGRRSVFAKVNLNPGDVIQKHLLAVLRPGIGLKPIDIPKIIGRKIKRRVKAQEPITLKDF